MTVALSDQLTKLNIIQNCIDSILQTNNKLAAEVNQVVELQNRLNKLAHLNTIPPTPKRKRNSSAPSRRHITRTRLFCQEV